MPVQPAVTNGSTSARRHPVLKWTLIALAIVWSLAIVRVGFFDTTSPNERVSHGTRTATGASTATTANTEAAPLNASVGAADTSMPSDADTQVVEQVIESFVTTWLVPGTSDQRQVALTPLATPDLVSQLALTPPDALPQAQLTGIPQIISMDATTAVATATLSDGTTFALRLQRADANSTWLVAALDKPAGPTAPPPEG